MINIKRIMSLALALVLTLSICAVGANAAYKDSDTITNTEAVDVLTAIGVIQGDDTGNFRPTDGLSRAEGCTIIAKLLGQGDYSGASTFVDMENAKWADGVVAYCRNNGIIDGVGNNKFDPSGKLTGYAFGKMLLGALGYKAHSEGMTGAAWEAGVNKLIKKLDMTNGIKGFNGHVAISREDAAQMALNTLKATMVEYTGGSEISSGDVNVTVYGTRYYVAANGKDYAGRVENNTQEFCEEYFPALKISVIENDFGRPDTQAWTLDGTAVYNLGSEFKNVKSYTTAVKTGEMYSVIGKSAFDALKSGEAKLTVFVDGTKVKATVSDYFEKNGTATSAKTGNGVITEIYADNSGNVTIVHINTYLAQAVTDYNEKRGSLEIQIYGCAAKTSAKLSNEDFTVADIKNGEWLICTMNNGEIYSVKKADTVTGKVDSYTADKSIRIGGKTYEYSAVMDTETFKCADFVLGSNVTAVVDPCGYILGIEAERTEIQYVFVSEIAKSGNFGKTYMAAVVLPDGKYAEVEVKAVDNRTPSTDDSGWYGYTVNNGVYTLTTAGNAVNAEGEQYSVINNRVQFIYDKDTKTYAAEFRATAETVFITESADGVYRVYSGYNKVPAINTDNAVNIRVEVVCDNNGFAKIVFICAGEAKTEQEAENSGKTVIILNGEYSVSIDEKGNTCYSYTGIVDGERTEIKTNGKLENIGIYADVTENADGCIDVNGMKYIAETNDDFVICKVTDTNAKLVSNILCLGDEWYAISSDCEAYSVENGAVNETSAAAVVRDIAAGYVTDVYGIREKGEITCLYAICK